MGKDKSSLIASSRKFAQKNKFCMFLAICYITVVVFSISFYKHFRTQIIRIVCLAALFAAFVLITSFNPVVYNLEYVDGNELSDVEIELSEDTFTDVENVTEEYVDDSISDETFDKDDWNLILVNKQNKIPDDYDFELVSIDGKLSCDKRILDSLHNMFDDAANEDIKLIACSTYRNMNWQTYLFDKKIKGYMSGGESFLDSYKRAATEVTVPGTSEHEIGIAIDIMCAGYYKLDEGFEDTEAGVWLKENSYKYGFILRYPKDKEEITGISYEPWHYRYVGVKAAEYIYENSLTLEEFVEGL